MSVQKWHQILAAVVAVLTLLAKGTVALPVGIPAEWGSYFISWDNFLLAIYGVAAPVLLGLGDNQSGFFTSPPVAKAIERATLALAVGLILTAGWSVFIGDGSARAQAIRHHIIAKRPVPAPSPSNGGGAISYGGPLSALAAIIATDLASAEALSTAIPALQDGNGQICWRVMANFGAIVKAHPLPATLRAATDLEALRLQLMAAHQVCESAACTQVFAELSNSISAVALGLPIPSLNSLCAKVPPIAVVAPNPPAS